MDKRFSAKYPTAKAWLKAHENDNSPYAQRVRRAIKANPNITLSEARGHKTTKAKPKVSKEIEAKPKPTKPKVIGSPRTRALHVVGLMRRKGLSLKKAARQYHISPKTVLKYVPEAIRKVKGKYKAKKRDTYERRLYVYADGKLQIITVNDSREASKIGKHWNAVKKWRESGKTEPLEQFQNVYVVDAKGKKHKLETDERRLFDIMGSAPPDSFAELYPPDD